MSTELTGTDVDRRLLRVSVDKRWRASIDGYDITYSTFGYDPGDQAKIKLLKLRAVIQAIDDSGGANGVPLRSYQVPLLCKEFERLQREVVADDVKETVRASRARGGANSAGRRSPLTKAVQKAITEKELWDHQEILTWFREDCPLTEFDDGTYSFFHSDGTGAVRRSERAIRQAIRRERKKYLEIP